MNYSQNTGYTNSTKHLLCAWIPKFYYDCLCNDAKSRGTNYTEVLTNLLKNAYRT